MKIVLTLASLLLSICVISTSAAPDYKVDAGFQPPVFTGPFATKIHTALALPDGKILVGGSFTTVGGQPIKYSYG